jgi:hypothetical protein
MASEPAYITAFQEYIDSPPGAGHRTAMEREFYGESDRACGILQASWTELILERAIRSRLRNDGAGALFGPNGPLGNFSNKIAFGYSLGLYEVRTRHDLNLIRRIRNGFAHCQLPLRFDISAVKGVCDHLYLPDLQEHRCVPPIIFDRAIEEGEWHDRDHPRERFIICCYSILSALIHVYQLRAPRDLHEGSGLP